MVDRMFRRTYKSANKKKQKPLLKMTPAELVGYYLVYYPHDPIKAVTYDINEHIIPAYVGETVKIVLTEM